MQLRCKALDGRSQSHCDAHVVARCTVAKCWDIKKCNADTENCYWEDCTVVKDEGTAFQALGTVSAER